MVYGPMQFVMKDGSVTHCSNGNYQGTLIPPIDQIEHIVMIHDANKVLVIEKEATFITLLRNYDSINGCVIITVYIYFSLLSFHPWLLGERVPRYKYQAFVTANQLQRQNVG